MSNNVIAQVSGGDKQVVDGAKTVKELKAKMGLTGKKYQATANGDPVGDDYSLEAGDHVIFTEDVKGA